MNKILVEGVPESGRVAIRLLDKHFGYEGHASAIKAMSKVLGLRCKEMEGGGEFLVGTEPAEDQ